MNEIKKTLKDVEKLINSEIKKIIPKIGTPQTLYDALWYFLSSGGKKLRPALLITACEALGGRRDDAIPAACALEIIHNFLLIHDDIEDSSLLRRGVPTLHVKYGMPHATNTGDFLAFKAYECLFKGKDIWGLEKSLQIVELVNDMLLNTVEGQAMDIDKRNESLDKVSLEWYKEMCFKKTGYYTGGTPCAIGGLIAGGNDMQIKALKNFGFNIGVAFQIQDDILNLRKGSGKEFGDDIKEGKRTAILIHAFSNADTTDKRSINQILGKENASIGEKMKIIQIFEKYGSIEFAKKYSEVLVKKSMEELIKDIPDLNKKSRLINLADFFIKRSF